MIKQDREKSGIETKKKLIIETYKIIRDHGLEGVTAREVAKNSGVSATMIYKHFDNINYLIAIASLYCISDYLDDLVKIANLYQDPIDMDLAGWKSFCTFAFRNPPLYANLFWGPCVNDMEDICLEYFRLFPHEFIVRQNGFLINSLFTGDINRRDFIWMRRGANVGRLTYDDAVYLSRTNCLIVYAMLMEHSRDYKEVSVQKAAAEECLSLIQRNIDKCLIKG